MDYEKKHKEEVVRATQLWECGDITRENLEYIFPELKESEDDKIRKELLESFKYQQRESRTDKEWLNGIKLSEVVAWLEKQGKHKDYYTKQELIDMGFSFTLNGDIVTPDKMMEDMKKYLAWHEKQGEQKPIINVPSRDVILSIWDLGNEWKELTNGSISTEYGTQLEYIQKHWQESEYYLRAKQGEQKTTNNVEPKFKVGDWIVSSVLGTAHIIGVNDSNEYQLEYIDGKQKFSSIDYVNYEYDEWTIEDAKDGDVLVYGDNPADHHLRIIMLFKSMRTFNSVRNHFHIFADEFRINDWCDCGKTAHPATKEQRDTLFTKMNEAGYEFDFEKKELKKIEKQGEQKETLCDKCKKAQPSHLCQDIITLGKCYIESINTSNKIESKSGDDENSKVNDETNAPTGYGKYVDECLNEASKHFFSEGEDTYSVADLFYAGVRCGKSWLEKQGKLKWTKEDEDNLNMAIYFMRSENTPYSPTDVEPVVDWLNSIKQRLGGDDYERK